LEGSFLEIDPVAWIGTALACLGLLVEHFYFQAKLQERIAVIETKQSCMEGMEGDVREIKTKVNLFWSALEDKIPSLLLQGNPIEPDSELFQLLQKYMAKQITNSELVKLSLELEEEAAKKDKHSAGEILAIVLISAIVRSKLIDQGQAIWSYTLLH